MESNSLYYEINEQPPSLICDLLLARDILKHVNHPFHAQLTHARTIIGALANSMPLPEICREQTTWETLTDVAISLHNAALYFWDMGDKNVSALLPETTDEEQIIQRNRTTGELAGKLSKHALRFNIMANRFRPSGHGARPRQLLPR